MGPVALLAVLLALLTAAASRPEINDKYAVLRGYTSHNHKGTRTHQALNGIRVEGCLYGGRWYAAGAAVTVRACMRCTCTSGGALSCARRACAPTPEPPLRCHLLHRRDACCPELHCPEGVTLLEHTATSRADDDGAFTVPTHVFPVCVEEGVSYAAGSALDAHVACEQCFCLGGVRRCVSPRCLPPPSGCRARPAAGACCPTRYYCDHSEPTTPAAMAKGDCFVNGTRVAEGDRATRAESGGCERCFCLRGDVRCQPMACAPPLLGCTPLLRPGDCCPHRYQCHNTTQAARIPLSPNYLSASRAEYRSLPIAAKVKRKTGDPPPAMSTTTRDVPTTTTSVSTAVEEESTTLQPEGTVKIIINGTINCTAELSSETGNETRIITAESSGSNQQPGESFVVNVTSSLHANITASAAPSSINISVPSVPSLATTAGDTNRTKEDYEDYEYAEPTLPPSLPNLKIIPFVAADAVVDDEPPPVPLTYPLLEREDNFPVYYREDDEEQQEDAKNKTPITTSSEPSATTTVHSKAPAVNKFSPPIQTEGGFVPKGPGILGEYYAVYPSTSSPAPLLSTSMPLTTSGDCVTSAGRRVLAGGVLQLPCQRCECLWGRLRCVPTPCAVPIAPVLNATYTPSTTTTTSTSKVTQTESTTITSRTTTTTPASVTKSVTVTEQRTPVSPASQPAVSPAVTHRATTPAIRSSTPPALPLPSNDIGDGSSDTSLLNHDTTPAEVITTQSSLTETPAEDQSDEEEEDEGFSFGSVLKLLLSEYDTSSSTSSTRQPPAASTTPRPAPPSTRRPPVTASSSRRPPPSRPTPSIVPPRPLPDTYTPPIKSYIPNSVNRIDHLVLGEATAIKQRVPMTTVRPPSPVSTVSSPTTTHPTVRTTKYSAPATRSTSRYSVPPVTIGPPLSKDAGNGLPKLAGCNIYGRMYRVGRIITELSTPCQECRCTVAGVHCHALPC